MLRVILVPFVKRYYLSIAALAVGSVLLSAVPQAAINTNATGNVSSSWTVPAGITGCACVYCGLYGGAVRH